MTRYNDSDRRASRRGSDREKCMLHGRGVRRRACTFALCALLGVSAWDATFAAQYQQTPNPYHQTLSTQQRQNVAQGQQSHSPALFGIFGQQPSQNAQPRPGQPTQSPAAPAANRQQAQSQEPQRLGVFGTRPLLSGLKPQDPQTQRQNQEFHAHSQHLNAQGRLSAFSFSGAGNSGADTGRSVTDLAQASTSPADASDALAKVPWNLFPEKTRARLQQLASSPTMYRRLPMAGGRCNPELFDFFLTYPNTVVELWKQMGYDEVDMKQTGAQSYDIREKDGSNGRLTILFQNADLAVAHVSGSYRAPGMLRPVEGEALLILQARYTEDAELTPIVICRLDAFVNIKNPGVDLVARTFNSMIGRIADTNFQQTLAFIDSVSQTAEQDPRQFQGVVMSLSGLSPTARKILADKAFVVAQQAQSREHGQLVNYQLLAKANDPNPGYARLLSRGSSPVIPGETRVAESRSGGFQGYSTPEADDAFFFDESGDIDASYAESGFSYSAHSLGLGSSGDFALAEDDVSEYDIGYEGGETIMTGDEYLATQRSTFGDESSSLAHIGAKPSQNARAMRILDEEEDSLDETPTLFSGAKALSTDDEFSVEDEELELDSFVLASDDEEEDAAPVAIPLSSPNAPATPTRLPSTVRPFVAPYSSAANRTSVVATDDVDDEPDPVAEISFDEDGNPVLEFTLDDESVEDSATDVVTLSSDDALALVDFPDDADNSMTQTNDTPTLEIADPSVSYTQTVEEPTKEVDVETPLDGGWTRSVLANRAPATPTTSEKPSVKTLRPSTSSKKPEPVQERKPLVTRRYSAPTNASKSLVPVKPENDKSKDKSAALTPQDGDRIPSYRWTPVPGSFVAKTAAIDLEEDTISPKTPVFSKPER